MPRKPALLAYRVLLLSSAILLLVGLVWFLTPSQYVLQNGYGYLLEYPNWRGLMLVVTAVVVSMTAAIILWHYGLGTSRATLSLGLLVAGFVSMLLGLIWLFTPRVEASGDAILIEYPNAGGLPYIGLAAFLWIGDGLALRRPRVGDGRIPVSLGLLVAGLVALVLGVIIFPFIDLFLGTVLFRPFEMVFAIVLWVLAVLILLPFRRRARLSTPP